MLPQFARRYHRADLARRYRYVFVVTYGRSGSTLLMGLLNTIPGYRIRGENGNALYRLYQAQAVLDGAHRRHGGDESRSSRNPWYGAHAWRPSAFRRALLDAFVADVLCPRPGDRVLGFKEIRYTEAHLEDLTGYLDFLRKSFPASKIVFNHRLPDDVARSAWWAEHPGSLERVQAADRRLSAFPADARHFHFHYDRIDDSLDNIRELFAFLGEELDEARVRATLDTRHSYKPAARGAGGTAAPTTPRGTRRLRRLARRVVRVARRR
ncbi:sulfotransferase [Micromonospora endolithica]|uniref:Sulfotransferase n=1 Tax=Micromonospora endolithica TaxID=230091 RepID=A0A3A9ZL51_9ACTN|nr:sulfotransferase [Micromonospora endolithica]RKN49092.1 hypothetical protein D7223_06115 [Micromonospora endolithica]TWJ23243.1 sulfotransferase family protein [Micromonospora endolithica]